MKVLIVVDMQNDFITGSLGTPEAQAIVPNVVEKIKNHVGPVIYTFDTHKDYYLTTLEGRKLPVKHCIDGTEGWELHPQIEELRQFADGRVLKPTFGADWHREDWSLTLFKDCDEIELCGLCTDICVISNALILRAMYPNKVITVDSTCCAGVTPAKHEAALEVMRSCQIDVVG